MKWGVVLAGASDFLRPAEKLSITQNLALMATGSIWTRWCFVIKPKNMLYVLFRRPTFPAWPPGWLHLP
jgi:mitochondrial pyruvate carrier 2